MAGNKFEAEAGNKFEAEAASKAAIAAIENTEESSGRFVESAAPAFGSLASDSSVADSLAAGQVSDSQAADSDISAGLAADSQAAHSYSTARAAGSQAFDLLVSVARNSVRESACFAELLAARFAESFEVAAWEQPVA